MRRRSDSRKRRLDVVSLEHLPEKASPSVEPTETRLAVLEALKQLPPRARAVVVLRYWEDMSVEQTAAVLDISQGSAKSMANRGLGLPRERVHRPRGCGAEPEPQAPRGRRRGPPER
jgi:RNA polymerase sigma factor (sigma-70 family)